MVNTFKAGTLLVYKATGLGYLVEETFTMTRTSEFRQVREVATLQIKTIKLDLSSLYEQYEIVVPDDL